MSAAREKDQADFDLERLISMFDDALTSRDPRVVDTLRSLMMIVALTKPEGRDSGLHDRHSGPLRRLFEDMRDLTNRIYRLEENQRQLQEAMFNNHRAAKERYDFNYPYEKYTMAAASQMAQQVDQDLLNTLKIKAQGKFKGL